MALSEPEALAILERRPQDVAAISAQLKELTALGEDGFLIVSLDDVYVQFMVGPGAKSLFVEAVSNDYLPAKKRLDEAGIALLLGLGFEAPEGKGGNFSMEFERKGDADFALLAVLERPQGGGSIK
jgi:hypothetical protein